MPATSGACPGSLGGAASGRPGAPWSATKPVSAGGNASTGPPQKARRERRTIVFIDESGLSERPHRCRTWAPRGQTPVLQYHFHWKTLSAIAGVNVVAVLLPAVPRHDQESEIVDFWPSPTGPPRKALIIWSRRCGSTAVDW
ncbi:transposase [bacterium]|nr:transposase [bacterium]